MTNKLTIATTHSGGEGVGEGARAAGLRHLWGLEHKDAIAQVARDNGFNVLTGDVTTWNPTGLEPPDVLHASPPCPNFSNAKQGGIETEQDIELARATVRFLTVLKPRYFTLENVWLYRKSKSWALIQDTLNVLGYWSQIHHLNAADFGVPQTRKRMIVRAVQGGFLPPLPPAEKWIGWYETIKDLLPGLPNDQFAPWQITGMPEGLYESTLVDSAGYPDKNGVRIPVMRKVNEPANTIVANLARRPMRAFLVTGVYGQPMGTPNRKVLLRQQEQPAPVVTAGASVRQWRAAIPGRVVKMTSRCLARFQSFPDSYHLPDNAALAATVIGNAVPPLMYQKIVELFE